MRGEVPDHGAAPPRPRAGREGQCTRRAADALGSIEAHMPCFGISDHSGMQPEIRIGPAHLYRGFELRVGREERVVGLSALDVGLINDAPTENLENWLNEFLFEAGFVSVLCNPGLLALPKAQQTFAASTANPRSSSHSSSSGRRCSSQ